MPNNVVTQDMIDDLLEAPPVPQERLIIDVRARTTLAREAEIPWPKTAVFNRRRGERWVYNPPPGVHVPCERTDSGTIIQGCSAKFALCGCETTDRSDRPLALAPEQLLKRFAVRIEGSTLDEAAEAHAAIAAKEVIDPHNSAEPASAAELNDAGSDINPPADREAQTNKTKATVANPQINAELNSPLPAHDCLIIDFTEAGRKKRRAETGSLCQTLRFTNCPMADAGACIICHWAIMYGARRQTDWFQSTDARRTRRRLGPRAQKSTSLIDR